MRKLFLIIVILSVLNFSLSAFAEGTGDIVDTGKCGEKVNWMLNTNGGLIISGVGEVDDYASFKNAPWYGEADKIHKLTISYGVTNIGSFAFSGCANLEEVVIADSVNRIGESSFSGCKNLVTIKMPYEAESIGRAAFKDCTSITTLRIPNGVTELKDNTFYGCSSLNNIYLPQSVTTIGNSAFNGCTALSTVYYSGSENDFYNALEISGNNMPLLESYVESGYIDEAPTYTIRYFVNGTQVNTQNKKYDESVQLLNITPQKTNYEFIGWSESSDSETAEYVKEGTYSQDSDIKLYAVWQKKLLTVTSSLPSGAYFNSGVSLRKYYLSCDNDDADIYYTIDGTDPTNHSTLYEGGWLTLSDSIALKAVAYLNDELFSSIAEYTYIYDTKLYVVEKASFDKLKVEQGTDLDSVLPQYVRLKTSNNDTINASVVWDVAKINTDEAGSLNIDGFVTLPSNDYSWFDEEYKDVSIIVEVSEKSVLPEDDILYGDINGDKKIDMKDATRLLKYLSNWEVDIVQKASDLNADEKIDMKDATRLLKHLAGWDGELGIK